LNVERGDVIIAWNQALLAAVRADESNVGLASRSMAMAQAAVYDAVNDILRTGSVFHIDVAAPARASPEAAASAAPHTVLRALYPDQAGPLSATLIQTLATVPGGQSKLDGLSVGVRVGLGILDWRANDGSSLSVPYTPGDQPGQWRPTPPDYANAWGPEWGQ